jgi:hypothetical protein
MTVSFDPASPQSGAAPSLHDHDRPEERRDGDGKDQAIADRLTRKFQCRPCSSLFNTTNNERGSVVPMPDAPVPVSVIALPLSLS